MDVTTILGAMRCLCANNSLYEPLCKQCKYLKNPKGKIELLRKKLELLEAHESTVKEKLNEEKVYHGRDPNAVVKLWLQNVKLMTGSINIEELCEADKSCLCGCFPNYISRIKLGKLVEKKIYEIDELLVQQENFQESSLASTVPRKGWIFPIITLIGETSRRVLETTWNYLMDGDIGIIGIYGMGGVGKTTVAIEINNRLLKNNIPVYNRLLMRNSVGFDNVIWVTASKDSSIQKLQKDIANKVDLNFEEDDDEMTRAAKLMEFLSRKARFLLIIDDLWEGFSLESIGIPNPRIERICKIIITTRSLNVCHQMETDEEVEVGMLLETEGWELFKQKVGAQVFSPEIEDYAKSVARECGGLPLAIITVGRALRKETNLSKWHDALEELRNSPVSFTNMEKLVFSRLRFSYERLSDQATKSCFLFCALYPKDHFIDTEELVNYWMCEGLLEDTGSIKRMQQLGRSILRELKDASMLEISAYESGKDNEHVKMHDLIREMAIGLTTETSMIQSGLGMDKPPAEHNWTEQIQKVSLMRNDLSTLDSAPNCPNLRTLLLQYNSLSKEINPDFFRHMGELRILDLSFTGIVKLPESFSYLKNLHALLLRSCWNLRFLPTLAGLSRLMVLDLAYTSITSIPGGMEMLHKLRHLDLSSTSIINFQISILFFYPILENLLVMGGLQLSQVDRFYYLQTLEISFQTFEKFQDYIKTEHWCHLKSFKFCIGDPPFLVNILKNGTGLFGVPIAEKGSNSWPSMHELIMYGCTNIICLPNYIAVASTELKICRVNHCDQVQWILNGEWSTFPKLEMLEIEGLRNLTELFKGMRREGFLASLRILHVTACNNLKFLIPSELVQCLTNLEEIELENCKMIEQIFEVDEEKEEITEVCNCKIVLPSLKRLKLSSLQRLKSICNDCVICDSLSEVDVRYCQQLNGLPLLVEGSSLLSSVELIDGYGTWSKLMQRDQDDEDSQGSGSNRP